MKPIFKDEHKFKRIKINGKFIKVDTKIIPLVKVLNEFGIKTKHSCQGERRGSISIDKKNLEIYSGLVNGEYELILNLKFPTPKR